MKKDLLIQLAILTVLVLGFTMGYMLGKGY